VQKRQDDCTGARRKKDKTIAKPRARKSRVFERAQKNVTILIFLFVFYFLAKVVVSFLNIDEMKQNPF